MTTQQNQDKNSEQTGREKQKKDKEVWNMTTEILKLQWHGFVSNICLLPFLEGHSDVTTHHSERCS